MIRSDGNTSFLVQYNKYNNANKNFYKLLQIKYNKPEINLIISGNVREKWKGVCLRRKIISFDGY